MSSTREFDISAKKAAEEFKGFIKTKNKDCADKMKHFLNEGFQNYYEELTKKLNDEFTNQESHQNKIQDKIHNEINDIEKLHVKVII